MSLRDESLGTVLGIWAHPDDEAFLAAGVMASAVASGSRVVSVSATRGELGAPDAASCPPEYLAGIREQELAASLGVLGVEEHRFLGFVDGTCHAISPILGVGLVARLIREVRPDTILTFGPEGMTGHADHQAVSRWVTRAWAANGAPGCLLYATTPPGFGERFADLHERFNVFEVEPPVAPYEDLALHMRLDGELLDRKTDALMAHASQLGPLAMAVGEDTLREWWAEESFVDAGYGQVHALAA